MGFDTRDIKELVKKSNEIYTKIGVIEERVNNLIDHIENQDTRLNKHSCDIRDLAEKSAVMETKFTFLVAAVGFVSGIIGSLITKYLGGFL